MEKIQFKKGAKIVSTDGFWYDLFDGGFGNGKKSIELKSIFKNDEDYKRIMDAKDVLENFKEQLESQEILEEC